MDPPACEKKNQNANSARACEKWRSIATFVPRILPHTKTSPRSVSAAPCASPAATAV